MLYEVITTDLCFYGKKFIKMLYKNIHKLRIKMFFPLSPSYNFV